MRSEEACHENDRILFIQQETEPVEHSEGPHWSQEEEALFFVDISGHAVHKFVPHSKSHTSVKLNDTVGVVVPVEGQDAFVIGYGREVTLLKWDGASDRYTLTTKFRVDQRKRGNRFNDGKADAKGNLWIGTMGEEKPVGVVKPNQGTLFKVSNTCQLTSEVSPVSISNGIAWNKANDKMFYIDTPTRRIDVFDYDLSSGTISNQKPFFEFEKFNVSGSPDGMTIDTEDNLWVACWGGSQVIEISKAGILTRSVSLPVERVTSVAWGGPNLDVLYVTSMRTGLTPDQLKTQPNAGALFSIKGLGAKGWPGQSVSECFA